MVVINSIGKRGFMTEPQQAENKTGQGLPPTATPPSAETTPPGNWQALQDAIKNEAAKVHSTLRKDINVKDFYGKIATGRLSELEAQINELHEANDALLEKSEDGKGVKALMNQVKENDKKIKAKEAELNEREFKILGREQIADLFVENVVNPLNAIEFNKSIEDKISERIPGQGKDVDEARKRAIDAVKAAKPTKPEELTSIIDIIVPAIKASAPASVGGGPASTKVDASQNPTGALNQTLDEIRNKKG
jgi:hypothetical protein